MRRIFFFIKIKNKKIKIYFFLTSLTVPCFVLCWGTIRTHFRYIANFRYVVKISLCSEIFVHSENFAIIAKFPMFLQIALDLHSASKFSLELQKLIQEKLRKIAEK